MFNMKMEVKKIKENVYEIERVGNMRVPARIYASEKIMEAIKKDKTLTQVKNVATLPGIIKHSIALADAHQGYGFSIGGVAAFDMERGIISPGGVGYDINCSVRLLKTNLTKKDILEKQKLVNEEIYRKIPSGVGRGSPFNLTKDRLLKILKEGSKYIIKEGYGVKDDYLHTEDEGAMPEADPSKVSTRALKRGIGQLGTLGAGNHFLEVQFIDEIYDEKLAKVFGIKKDQVMIMIHCGSRGLGHQVASDYIKAMEEEYGYENLADRELINAPIKSKLGKDYFSAMSCAANFAFANKQLITHWVRDQMNRIYPKSKIDVVYDVCHNIAKFEEYDINGDGKKKKVCVHRKGATRSFGPGRKEVPEKYRKIGQPVIIPGSMGTASYLLVGTTLAENLTFGSTVHGAGRVMGRGQAFRTINKDEVKKDLDKKGISLKSGSYKTLIDEAPQVYKNINEVVRVVSELGINKKVARLKPLIVIKG